MIRRLLAPVVQNVPLAAPRHHVLTMHAPEIARDARPGQFVAIASPETAGSAPQLLRRPFSVFTTDPNAGEISILFSIYGVTTHLLSLAKPGDAIDILGPLGGRTFEVDDRGADVAHHVLVGGGYGVPPLAFFARTLRAANPSSRVTLIVGARTQNLLVGVNGLAEIGVNVICCTDDGSFGSHGLVTVPLLEILQTDAAHTHAYACGPTPMMRAIAEMSLEHGARCDVSMEPFMPCGVGICMGCAVTLADGTYARGCTDGPVFAAEAVRWN